MRIIVYALAGVVLVLFLATMPSCTHNPYIPEDPDINPTDTTTTDSTACDTLNISLSNDVAPIFQARCYSCHNTAFQSGGIALDSFPFILAALDSGLIGSINHEAGFVAMPQGTAKLPDCDIAKIEAWVNAGTPNN